MKALLLEAPKSFKSIEMEPPGRPGAGEALVRVHRIGICGTDLSGYLGKMPFFSYPRIPGHELGVEVIEVGDGVTNVKPGDRVVALMPWGGYAERVVTDAVRLIAIPDGVSFVQAAATLTTYGTTYYALADRAHLAKGETLLVLGAAGGVGLAAVQLGKLMGARVIAAASSPEKLETCKQNGAELVIDYAKEDLKERVKALTNGAGADVVYDPVGGKYSEAALRATAWNGRLLVVGFAAGEIPKIPLNLTLLKGASIIGVFWGQFTMRDPGRALGQFRELFGWVKSGKLAPHVHATPPLADAASAMRTLLDRKVQGKIVLVV
ncbi:MAG TPA: NADPH:quinone oxidoreductase family protein [Polyangia bacterium]